MKIIKAVILIFLTSLALAATTNASYLARDPTCAPLVANVHSCSDALRSGNASAITPPCRDGLRAIEATEASLGAPAACRCISQCIRAHFPQVYSTTLRSFDKLALNTDEDVGTSITTVMKAKCDIDLACL